MRFIAAWAWVILLSHYAPVSALDNGVGRTPMMGWMAWIRFRCNINCEDDPDNCIHEKLFMEMADRMADDGWRDAGYKYLSLDDCWMATSRTANNSIRPDPSRFPSGMKALGDYIHSKGLLFGLYTAVGSKSCCGFPSLNCSSVEHCDQAHQDVQTYVSWGIDYIKVDSCKNYNASSFNTTHPLISSWFLEAGKAANRPVLYHPSGVALRDETHVWPNQYKLCVEQYGGRIDCIERNGEVGDVLSDALGRIGFCAD
jgi:hypothetical protein